ncbi:MAG: hypothetical protein AB8B57_05420 [Congregibacter sp.]
MNASQPYRNALFAVGMLTLMTMFMTWAYQPFVDADYDSAWWVLTTLLDNPLSNTNAISSQAALALLLGSTSVVVAVTLASSSGGPAHRIIVSTLFALLWMTSQWQLVAIQTYGAQAYMLLHVPALATGLRFAKSARATWLCVLAALLVSLVIQALIEGRWALLSPEHLFLPESAELLPWAFPGAFSAHLELGSIWLWLHLCIPLIDALLERLRSAMIPLILTLGCLSLVNAANVAEQVQVRANPRLALLYSLAATENEQAPNPLLAWLALEHFDSIGGATQFDQYRAVLARTNVSDSLPEAYRVAVLCVKGEAARIPKQMSIEPELVLRFLHRNRRCGENADTSGT